MSIALTTVAGAIAACLAVSLCSLSSATALWLKPETLKWLVPNLVALAVGVLLGDAFIHLIPDAIQRHGAVSEVCLTVLIGMFVFFVLEKGVRWRHDHNVDTRPTADHILPLAKMNLIGDAMHNFVDGILIAGSFLADPVMGCQTALKSFHMSRFVEILNSHDREISIASFPVMLQEMLQRLEAESGYIDMRFP